MRYWPHVRLAFLLASSALIVIDAGVARAEYSPSCNGLSHLLVNTFVVEVNEGGYFAICFDLYNVGARYEITVEGELVESGFLPDDAILDLSDVSYWGNIIEVCHASTVAPHEVPLNQCTKWSVVPQGFDSDNDGLITGDDFPALRTGMRSGGWGGFTFRWWRAFFISQQEAEVDVSGRNVWR